MANEALERLRHHVSGAIERGEATPIVEVAPRTIGAGTPEERAKDLVARYGLAEAQRRAYVSKGRERYRLALIEALRDIELAGEA